MMLELTEEEKIDRIKILARAELQRTDWKIMRAIERMAAGDAWCAWRNELRKIASNPEGFDDLPPEPPFGAPDEQAEPAEPAPEVVEVPVAVEPEAAAPEPYTPDFTLIPDALAKYAEADETADDFRKRLKRLWQRFGIADGENFPGGGEPLSGEEKITMREIDIVLNSDEGRNAGLLQWLQADERNT